MRGSLLCIIVSFLLTITSCDGFKVSNNGDLDGMWHLVNVDSLDQAIDVDYSEQSIFWSFQADLLYVDDKTLHYEPCLLRFDYSIGNLSVFDPYIYNNKDEADEKIYDKIYLLPYGINALEEKFKIEELNRKSLVLRSNTLLLRFRKY